MRLFVTMPYSYNPSAMSREYLAEVVRTDALPNGMTGIGFKLSDIITSVAASMAGGIGTLLPIWMFDGVGLTLFFTLV